MFERYIIVPDSLRNMPAAGPATGFAFDVRLAYYRGLGLSMVEGFEISVDDETCDADCIAFHLGGETFSFDELAAEAEMRWEFNQAATLHVARPGGLAAGPHTLDVVEILRISYMPEPARRLDRKTLVVA